MDNTYSVEYAKSGRSKCKNTTCKKTIDQGALRIGKTFKSAHFDGYQTDYFHAKCIFESLARARKTTKKIESEEDLEGFQDIEESDKKLLKEYIEDKGMTKEAGKKTSKAIAKRAKAKSSRSKKAKEVEEEEEEEQEEEEKPTRRSTRQRGKKINYEEEEEDKDLEEEEEEEVEEEKPKKKKSAPKKKTTKKETEEEEEEEKVTTKKRKASKKEVEEEKENEEEEAEEAEVEEEKPKKDKSKKAKTSEKEEETKEESNKEVEMKELETEETQEEEPKLIEDVTTGEMPATIVEETKIPMAAPVTIMDKTDPAIVSISAEIQKEKLLGTDDSLIPLDTEGKLAQSESENSLSFFLP